MIDTKRAMDLLCEAARPLGVVRLGLEQAHGRVLAEPVRADRDFPPTDRSAMDGFAVRTADLPSAGASLEVVAELRAGRPVGDLRVGSGQAVRIMTGAIVPPGADAVVMVEHTQEQPARRRVVVDDVPRPGQHIRRRGEDLKRGEVVLEAGVKIRAAEIAALSSVGLTDVPVFRPPTVHVLSTGDEIVEPEQEPAAYQVRNSNARALMAQLRELDIEGHDLGIAGDDRTQLDRRLQRGLAGDVLLITGGVSVGAYDLVEQALSSAGMKLLFHRVAVKPGKPVLAGRCGDCLVVGLPGNPVSTFTLWVMLVAPALRKMMGCRRWANVRLRAALEEPLRAPGGRETYHLARLSAGPHGLTARRVRTQGSGDVLSLARANGFIVTPLDGADLPAGATVEVLVWGDGVRL